MKTGLLSQMTKGRKPLKSYLEKVFILEEHWLAPGRSGSLKFS